VVEPRVRQLRDLLEGLDDRSAERRPVAGERMRANLLDKPESPRWPWAGSRQRRPMCGSGGRAGTSLPHAVLLEQLAAQVRAELASVPNPRDPVAAFLLSSDRDRLGQLLGIHATRAARFRPGGTPRSAARSRLTSAR
jgi:hypothetical protein